MGFFFLAGVIAWIPLLTADEGYSFDHSFYAKVLQGFTNAGDVDYAALKLHRQDLDEYLESLARFAGSDYARMGEREKIAFWINASNALTIKTVIDHYPIKGGIFSGWFYPANSIRQIPGVWDQIHRIKNENWTLRQIEQILRKDFREPRVHFALACASKGCPRLRAEPYTGTNLEQQLDDQAHDFFQDSQKFIMDRQREVLYLSPLFDRFGQDFGPDSRKSVLAFVGRYVDPDKQEIFRQGEWQIQYLEYDWRLNEKKNEKTQS